jgi:cysteine desulfurase
LEQVIERGFAVDRAERFPSAEAFALALQRAAGALDARAERMAAVRDRFEQEVRARIPSALINGTGPRVPNTSNLRFPGVDAEAVLIALDLQGIAVSMGAACASGSVKPSHVLLAMGLGADDAKSSLRFSIGPETPDEEIERVVAALVAAVR